MIKALSLILLSLLILRGGKRGIKTFFTIYMNLTLLFMLIIIVGWGFNPTIPTIVICIIISTIILFFLNGINKKTRLLENFTLITINEFIITLYLKIN